MGGALGGVPSRGLSGQGAGATQAEAVKKKVGQSKQRSALNYVNKRAAQHRAKRGSMSKTEYKRLQGQWLAEFRSFTEEERFAQGVRDAAGAPAASSSSLAPSSSLGHFQHGDRDRPVSEGHVECFAASLDDSTPMTASRVREWATVVLPDTDLELGGSSPHLPVVDVEVRNPCGDHLSCQQQHFGFCVARHADVADVVRNVAAHLAELGRRCKRFPPTDKRRFRLLEVGEEGEQVYVLFVESLRLVATQQQVYTFVLREPASDDSIRMSRDAGGSLKIATSWMVAAQLASGPLLPPFRAQERRSVSKT